MNKTASKASKWSWSSLWNKFKKKNPTQLNIYNAHQNIVNRYKILSPQKQQAINQTFQEYRKIWEDYQNDTENTSQIIINTMSAQIKMFENISFVNSMEYLLKDIDDTSSENLALQHFQDTQAPSGKYIPVIQEKEEQPADDIFARYYHKEQCIIVYQQFQKNSPTLQYFLLLHEYRHHLQNLHNATSPEILKFYSKELLSKAKLQVNNLSWLIHEHDADTFAATHITCPTCLKILQIKYYNNKTTTLGYFSNKDLEPFVQAAQHNQCCPAHTKTPDDDEHNLVVQNLELKIFLILQQSLELKISDLLKKDVSSWTKSETFKISELDDLFQEMNNLDKQSGNLLAHIPNYNRDFIRKIAEEKEFQELLGAKLLKELDVRQTMAKTKELSQKGEFPLLEESKLTNLTPYNLK